MVSCSVTTRAGLAESGIWFLDTNECCSLEANQSSVCTAKCHCQQETGCAIWVPVSRLSERSLNLASVLLDSDSSRFKPGLTCRSIRERRLSRSSLMRRSAKRSHKTEASAASGRRCLNFSSTVIWYPELERTGTFCRKCRYL